MSHYPILQTKLYMPPIRPELVSRPHLVARLNAGLAANRKLALISAPAGFGKTRLVSEWVRDCGRPVARVSLAAGDGNPLRFLMYLVAAVQTFAPDVGASLASALQSPQPPPIEALLTTLLNEIAALREQFVLVLDDYHLLDSPPVDAALAFLLDHLPQPPVGGMHVVIASRENPPLPLARYRARGQLTEVRAADLRFTPTEAAEFLNRAMGLTLSTEDVAALETRTEGWIAGLPLAALALQGTLSMRGHQDSGGFIKSFTGSHHFVLDYLVEEVLHQQPERIQTFLLRTSILDRLCGSLCDAVLDEPLTAGQETLEQLERANLFIVPLDNERRGYRYHHLFASFFHQRLGAGQQQLHHSVDTPPGDSGPDVAALHVRASQWYEDNGLALEAFHHAAAASDVERAERLIGSKGMPIHFRPTVNTILNWPASLPESVRDARPTLWVKSATLSLVAGQTTGVEENLRAAERALRHAELDDETRDPIGHIACARATLALTRYEPEAMLIQAAVVLETIRYAEQEQQLAHEMQALYRQAVAARETERERLSRELDDGVLQDLCAVARDLKALEGAGPSVGSEGGVSLQELVARSDESVQTLRAICHGLRPPLLSNTPALALKSLVERLDAQSAAPVHIEISAEDLSLPEDTALALYRIVQESVHNAIQHADASEVAVRLTRYPDRLRMTITDDGRAIPDSRELGRFVGQGHFGLAGMRERAAMIGGHLEIQSAADYGTAVILEIPC